MSTARPGTDEEGLRRLAAPIASSLVQSFLNGLARVFTTTSAATLFLGAFDPGDLPWAYVASAALVALLGGLFVRTERQRGLLLAGLASSGLLAGALVVSWGLLGLPALAAPVAFALILVSEAEFTLTNVTFWGLAGRLFSVREAGRTFGLISAGEAVPTIAAGLLVPVLVKSLGVRDLLLLAAGAHALGLVHLALLPRLHRHRLARGGSGPKPGAGAPAKRTRPAYLRRYLALVASVLSLNVFVFYVVDNAFYTAARELVPGELRLAELVGHFYVALGVGSLLFRILLSGRLRARLGFRAALLATPACIAMAALGVVLTPLVVDDPEAVLWAVVVLKLLERLFVEGVGNPAYYNLFGALPESERTRAQAGLESVVGQAATVAAGVTLLWLNRSFGLGAGGLAVVALVFLELWLVVAWWLGRDYGRVLGAALEERRIRPGELPLQTAASERFIDEGLRAEESARVLYALHLVDGLRREDRARQVFTLLDHPQTQVGEAAARVLERFADEVRYPALLGAASERLVQAANAGGPLGPHFIGAAAALLKRQDTSPLWALAARRDLPVRLAALRALAAHGSAAGRGFAVNALRQMVLSVESEERRGALKVLVALPAAVRAGVPELAGALVDRDAAVRREAFAAVEGLVDERVLRAAADALSDGSLAQVASARLTAAGERAVPFVLEVLDRGAPFPHRLRAWEVLAQLAAPSAVAHLHAALGRAAQEGDAEAMRALAQVLAVGHRGERPDPAQRRALRTTLEAALEDAAALAAARVALGDAPAAELVREALDERLDALRDFLLAACTLLFDGGGLRPAAERLAERAGDELAVEALDAGVPPEISHRLLPLVEERSPARRARKLAERARVPVPGADEALRALTGRVPSWLGRCAAELAGGAEADATLARARGLGTAATFAGIPRRRLEPLARAAVVRRLDEGRTLEVPPEALVVVSSGALRERDGGQLWRAGEVPFPERVFGVGGPDERCVLEAAADATTVLLLPADACTDFVDAEPTLGWTVLVNLARGLQGEDAGGAEPGASTALAAAQELGERPLMERVLALQGMPLLGALDDRDLSALAREAEERWYEVGEPLVQEGERSSGLFLILDGTLRVLRGGQEVARLEAPGVVGELAAIHPAPRTATLVPLRPARALVLERERLRALAFRHPELMRLLRGAVCKRVRASSGDASAPGPLPLANVRAGTRG